MKRIYKIILNSSKFWRLASSLFPPDTLPITCSTSVIPDGPSHTPLKHTYSEPSFAWAAAVTSTDYPVVTLAPHMTLLRLDARPTALLAATAFYAVVLADTRPTVLLALASRTPSPLLSGKCRTSWMRQINPLSVDVHLDVTSSFCPPSPRDLLFRHDITTFIDTLLLLPSQRISHLHGLEASG